MRAEQLPRWYYEGRNAPKGAENPYGISQLKQKMWWFAGYDDADLFGERDGAQCNESKDVG